MCRNCFLKPEVYPNADHDRVDWPFPSGSHNQAVSSR